MHTFLGLRQAFMEGLHLASLWRLAAYYKISRRHYIWLICLQDSKWAWTHQNWTPHPAWISFGLLWTHRPVLFPSLDPS
jgi:hypothetical protein